MSEWVQLAISLVTIAGSLAGSLAVVSWQMGSRETRQDARITANTTAIETLAKATEKAIETLTGAIAGRATAESVTAIVSRLDRDEASIEKILTQLAERDKPPATDMIAMLNLAVQAAPLVRQLLAQPQARAA